jgi:uncharacterized protein (TIGR03067 family)
MQASILIGLALAVGAPVVTDPPQKEASIVGKWKLVGVTAAGRSLGPDDHLPNVEFEFAADGKYRVRVNGKADPEATYSADPSKDPAEVDFVDDKDGKKQQAIYKVEKDTLTLCWTEDRRLRPAKFEAAVGTRAVLQTFKRKPKE